jgi:phosphoribosylaminoimidazolecarboxamide formyltransferase/IMP cyclohydrolase
MRLKILISADQRCCAPLQKNHQYVTVVVDPADYQTVIDELKAEGVTKFETRRKLAAKVFRHTAAYDSLIAEYMTNLAEEENPETLTVTYQLKQTLRYGENPHQQAAFYKKPLGSTFSIANAVQLHGKELSYNNINDADASADCKGICGTSSSSGKAYESMRSWNR